MDSRLRSAERKLMGQSLAASVIIIFLIWWTLAVRIDTPYILPSPGSVFAKMLEIIGQETFWQIVLGTLRHVMIGFVLAVMLGLSTGLLSGRFKAVNTFVYPWVLLLRTTPVMSFILYLLLFVPTEWVAIWVSVFVVYPMIHGSVLEGYRQVDGRLLEMAVLYRVPRNKQLLSIYLPSIMPYFMSSAVTGMGVNIKAVITAEALSLPEFSVGTQLFNARNYLETESILAWTLLIILIAVILDGSIYALKWLATEGRHQRALQRRKS